MGIDTAGGPRNVVAVASGVISKTCTTEENGNARGLYVYIKHDDKYTTVSQHLEMSSITVSVGQVVLQGVQIGVTGMTGKYANGTRVSSGIHLHFEVHENGTPRDPLNYLPAV